MHFDESFWVAVSFAIFIALVYRPIARLMGSGLDKRAEKIRQELEEAVALKEEAQALLASYQRKHRQAEKESQAIIEHAEEQAQRIVKESKIRVEGDIKKRTDMAMQKIAQAEAGVIKEIKDNAVDITVAATQMLIAEHLSKDTADDLIDSAISSIDRKFH